MSAIANRIGAYAEDLTAQYRFVHMLRAGEGAKQYPDDWQYCVACCSADGETCVLVGFKADERFATDTKLRAQLRRAFVGVALSLGYKRVTWLRKQGAEMRHVEVPKAA